MEKETNNMIGKAIKQAREEAKITQPELAKKIGVSHASISFWENGVNIPSVDYCWKLADIFGISIDELVGRKQ